ncbi:MAG: NYN domain-containing protein [Chloroflexi bacterium]|nr:NYN domain-containing protein [Chloroflexota bacterium]
MTGPSLATGGDRIAMLIDGDNAQPSLLGEMIAEAGKYGLVTIRRIYGDWTTTNMNSWKEILNVHAIQPIQQFRYTVGKNATDSAMIIDAMDILYEGVVSGFCLVSSDSDYTRLATRIREKGFFVMGIGERKTPKAFVNACEVFVYTDNLRPEATRSQVTQRSKEKGVVEPSPPDPLPLLRNAFDMSAQEDGWAFLGAVGSRLRQLDPGFDARTYGFKQLSQLIRSYSGEFELREKKSKSGPSDIYIKLKDKAAR